MQITKKITPYIVFSEDSVLRALQKISKNKSGIVFTVGEGGILEGVMTDGDFRRWLFNKDDINLNAPVSKARNEQYIYADIDAPPAAIMACFSKYVVHVPLVDKSFRLIAIAINQGNLITISGREIGDKKPVFVIAEIGNNHNGNFNHAQKLVNEAIAAGADCVKFQMRDMDTLYRKVNNQDRSKEDLGTEYTIDLLKKNQLPPAQLFIIFDYCKAQGVIPLCSPWDLKSLESLESYGLEAYKVASADLTNHQLIQALIALKKPIIFSTGMSTEEEIDQLAAILKDAGTSFALLHCNSTYPAPFGRINLSYISRLKEKAGSLVGYSGHERGYSVPLAAVAIGAKIIEKHITLDRNQEGNDHRISLLPSEFKKMVEGIREIEQAMGENKPREISQGELINREVLGKSLVAGCDIDKGSTITREMVVVKSPGQGLPPYKLDNLVGRSISRAMREGDFFFYSDLAKNQADGPCHYEFSRLWGLPVRYHDIDELIKKFNLDLVEFHLSYRDLEDDLSQVLGKYNDLSFIVHSPELFAGDHILDLCSEDDSYRRHSVSELQRVISVCRRIRAHFPSQDNAPCIIVNVGGASFDGHVSVEQKKKMYGKLGQSLSEIDLDGVEMLPQTMPPFPWHFGGQRYHNLFVAADEILTFCQENDMQICFDVSHSYLACAMNHWSFNDFVKVLGPVMKHLHIADAKGPDGEGLQIQEGEIDFSALAENLKTAAPKASFIPEIWQGHKDGGEGFFLALEKLKAWF